MSERNRKRRRKALGRILLLLIVLVGVITALSNGLIRTEEYEIRSAKIPAAFDGFRIVELSDIHAAEFFSAKNEYLISAVEDAQPDLIVLTGDLIDEKGDYYEQCATIKNIVTGIRDLAPVLYVTGNHEWSVDQLFDFLDLLTSMGVTVLRNEYVTVEAQGASIVVAGIDDPCGFADRKTVDTLMAEIRQNEGESVYTVLLAHRNDMLDQAQALGFDLVLSGHAHGGLIRLPGTEGLIGPNREWLPAYTGGLYTRGDTQMIVSRGIGNHTGVPRFLNCPHIPVAVLRPA
ncbi:MAG: metallophosphoesterase [Oscillospiraceae bacterium]|nr:metallophosphoesterase [Oscillospiraceae bacterium]